MLFLIEYKRSHGKLIKLLSFQDEERSQAEDRRLELELELNRQAISHEVVLLEAASEQALHETHRRYFEDSTQISQSLDKA